jgi:hypothetical protein
MAHLMHKPVQSYRLPAYPSRLEVAGDPDLLRRHVPLAWLSRKEMAGVLSVFLAVNGGGCSKHSPPGPATRPTGNDLAGKAAIVAPIFEHGDGRAADGCVVVNPPVFLSEQDALEVIREELGQAGLVSLDRDVRIEGVSIPARRMSFEKDWITGKSALNPVQIPGKTAPLDVDLKDPVHGIAIEFVSAPDYTSLGGVDSEMSVQSYDFKEVARWVGKQVSEQGRDLHLALFYDPVTRPDWDSRKYNNAELARADREKAQEVSKTESKRLLRQQVKDFVDWLKGQGVI